MFNGLIKGKGIRIPLGSIPFTIQYDFLLIGVLLYYTSRFTIGAAVEVLFWIGVSVLIHELGHALTGRYFGLKPQIRLLLLGGVTVWESHEPQAISPRNGILISLAGPMAGFVFGGIVWLVKTYIGWWPAFAVEPDVLLWYLLLINLLWGGLNLLPIYPMDGGQVLNYSLHYQKKFDPETVSSIVALVLIAVALGFTLWKKDMWLSVLLVWMGWSNVRRLLNRRDRHLMGELREANDLLDTDPEAAAHRAIELHGQLKSKAHREIALSIAGYGWLNARNEEKARAFAAEFPDYGDHAPGLKIWLINLEQGPEAAARYARVAFGSQPNSYLADAVAAFAARTGNVAELKEFMHTLRGHDYFGDTALHALRHWLDTQPVPGVRPLLDDWYHLRPEPALAYGFAAELAAVDAEPAIEWLRRAISADQKLARAARQDPQFAPVAQNPGFLALTRET